MDFKIATWNVNSVRLRIEQITDFLRQSPVDVIALQEIKCQADQFPREAFEILGYTHIDIVGQKGWHGVALCSRLPFDRTESLDFCRRGEARAHSVTIGGIEIWNLYIPAGGDIPDRAENDKFDHKLEFYERMTRRLADYPPDRPLIVLGDLNVAPGEFDVWSHKQMLKVVSHTPQEIDAFASMTTSGDLYDPFRADRPEPEKIFSWWSYRAADFRKSNRGLRLDHILLNKGARDALGPDVRTAIHDTLREGHQPSDHVPICLISGT